METKTTAYNLPNGESFEVTIDLNYSLDAINVLWACMQQSQEQRFVVTESSISYNGFKRFSYTYPYLASSDLAFMMQIKNIEFKQVDKGIACFQRAGIPFLTITANTEKEFDFNAGFLIDAVAEIEMALVRKAALTLELTSTLAMGAYYECGEALACTATAVFPMIADIEHEFDTDERVFTLITAARRELASAKMCGDTEAIRHNGQLLDYMASARRLAPISTGYLIQYFVDSVPHYHEVTTAQLDLLNCDIY